jgi:glycosyltransferase involved in cell wall biosynthesis
LTGKKPYEEIPEYIAAADVCILPAYPDEPIMQDIVPIKLYEYLAMGKPVITTRLPGIMKEFGEGNGVEYVEIPEMTINQSTSMKKTDEIESNRSNAREFVMNLDWKKITDTFESLLASACHE